MIAISIGYPIALEAECGETVFCIHNNYGR